MKSVKHILHTFLSHKSHKQIYFNIKREDTLLKLV